MIPLSLADVATIVGAKLHGDPEAVVDGPVVTDARECGPGSLFVARVGEHADGHDYVPQAVERGAVAALVTRPVEGLASLVVDDVQAAFEALARGVVDRLPDLTVVAVTGSSGKTSTKDLLAQVLSELGPTVAARESYNSEVGVPLTVLQVRPDTRYLVVEMGARGVGHIAHATRVVPPDVSVVLNVGSAHLGEFGSVEAVADAKSELVRGLRPDALAVLNADDPRVRAMAASTRARVALVGQSADAAVRAEDVQLDDQARAAFVLRVGGRSAPVRLALHGEHHVGNALAVAAVALELGMDLDDVAAALGHGRPVSRWRMEVTERPDGVTVVNDAYNANPESMRAALKALVAMGRGRRTWAVLGEMLELGADSVAEHDAIGRMAVRLDVSRLVAVGAGARALHTGAVMEGSWGEESMHVPDLDAAYQLLQRELREGDVVLLKSSRDAGLRALGDRLANGGEVRA
ncbi:MAG TPA: UDP-N-acetylmuramoyl-tripeptide--D-alanyl-D-alanine ligase [Actinomycetales bacterium]|nr:UDP-N-acetylmuramoyl-tripeptide--D-alanyl-D-alanine ligase [Actinomycetales bacterium]